MKLLYRALAVLSLPAFMIAQSAHAEDNARMAIDDDGMIYELPASDDAQVLSSVRALRNQLGLRRTALNAEVEDCKMGTGESVAAAILPGGLVYASVQKARRENAEARLEQVENMISDLSYDFVRLRAVNGWIEYASAE